MIPISVFRPVGRRFERLSSRQRIAACLAGIAVITVMGLAGGGEVSFSIFYLAPIMLMAWYADARTAVFFALLSALAWFCADQFAGEGYSQAWIGVWNAFVRLGFFLISVTLLTHVRLLLAQQRDMAETDGLTGLKNSRAFNMALAQEIERSRRYQHVLTLAYIDLDNFKQVNDRWGHEAGDAVLRSVAQTFRRYLRATDVAARLGGDEFALVLPQVSADDACLALEKIRAQLLEAMQERDWPVTFSIGAVTYVRMDLDLKDMVHVADELMYQVKSAGKNAIRHVCHGGDRTEEQQQSHSGGVPAGE